MSPTVVDDLLRLSPPFHACATNDDVTTYLATTRAALEQLRPWDFSAEETPSHDTAVVILRVLHRLHEIHAFEDPLLWHILTRTSATAADARIAPLASSLASILDTPRGAPRHDDDDDPCAWNGAWTVSLPAPPPSPVASIPVAPGHE